MLVSHFASDTNVSEGAEVQACPHVNLFLVINSECCAGPHLCVLERRATLDLTHHIDLCVLNSRGQRYLLPRPKCFQACKGGLGSSTESCTVKRQTMLSAERDANKKRADASISGDQGTSVVGKQINKS